MAQLICRETGAVYAGDAPIWRSASGATLDLQFEPRFPVDEIVRRPPSLWRYREAIPIARDEHIVSFNEGFTPLVQARIGERTALFKQDYLFPTGSFKDRGASVLISHATALGVDRVVEDSSGNAGCAMAAYCARAGLACEIYVPASASPGKLVQIESYGATLHRVPGTRQDTADAAFAAASGTFYASHCWHPLFLHGAKTLAYEIVEQLGWRAPEAVVIPAGHGTLLIGAHIGFVELAGAGLIDRIPKLIAVQAANCAPLLDAWQDGTETVTEFPAGETVAEGIAIVKPIRARQCLQAVRETNGEVVAVTETELAAALRAAAKAGFFIEPTCAAAVAGWLKLDHRADANTVVVLTGHGLKAPQSIRKLLNNVSTGTA